MVNVIFGPTPLKAVAVYSLRRIKTNLRRVIREHEALRAQKENHFIAISLIGVQRLFFAINRQSTQLATQASVGNSARRACMTSADDAVKVPTKSSALRTLPNFPPTL